MNWVASIVKVSFFKQENSVKTQHYTAIKERQIFIWHLPRLVSSGWENYITWLSKFTKPKEMDKTYQKTLKFNLAWLLRPWLPPHKRQQKGQLICVILVLMIS